MRSTRALTCYTKARQFAKWSHSHEGLYRKLNHWMGRDSASVLAAEVPVSKAFDTKADEAAPLMHEQFVDLPAVPLSISNLTSNDRNWTHKALARSR